MLRAARARLRGHWHKALQVRERLVLSEETLHLVLAGLVGVVGGLVNWVFYHAVRWLQWAIAGYPGHSIV